jgi:hypothetical protein
MSMFVSNRYGFCVVAPPKCGSTTIVRLMADIHDLTIDKAKRNFEQSLAIKSLDGPPAGPLEAFGRHHLQAMSVLHAGLRWIAIVRDPVDRAASAYGNKLNRFARRFRPAAYWMSKVTIPFDVLRRVPAREAGLAFLHWRISYRDYLETLAAKGASWDAHFMPQVDVMRMASIRYDRLIRLEDMDQDLAAELEALGVPSSKLGVLHRAERHNAAPRSLDRKDDQTLRRLVREIYKADFDTLPYPG